MNCVLGLGGLDANAKKFFRSFMSWFSNGAAPETGFKKAATTKTEKKKKKGEKCFDNFTAKWIVHLYIENKSVIDLYDKLYLSS